MAGGPILPFSAEPITAPRVFPVRLTAEMPRSLGFEASLGADAIWRLFYRMPPTIPTGTAKLLLACQANATTGAAKLNAKWKSWGANEVPAAASLTAEGTDTVTFATTAYRLTEVVRVLDADTFVGGELIMIDLTGETSSYTLAAVMGVLPPPIYWE